MPPAQPGISYQPSVPQPPLPQPPQQPTPMPPQSVPTQPMAPATKPRKGRKLLIIALVTVVVIAALAAAGYVAVIRLNNHDITTSVSPANYTQNTSLDGVTFWMSKQWGTPSLATNDHIDTLNYDSAKLDVELRASGHLTDYQNGHASDITPRQIKTYPYSLDKLYEVQILALDSFSTKQLSKDEVLSVNAPSSVLDLQLYHVNGKLVADYIQKGSGNAVDQRVIVMRDSTGAKEVRVVVNPAGSRKTTKDNFDGLMELVGSITFK